METEEHETCLPIPIIAQDDAAELLSSSGTMGTSKGVILTHRNIISASLMVTSDQVRYNRGRNVFLLVSSMSLVLGLLVVMYSQFVRGNTIAMMKKYELENTLRCINNYGATHWYGMPSVIVALTKNSKIVKNYILSSMRNVLSGGALLGNDRMEECKNNILPHILITQGYSMTETSGIAVWEDPREHTPLSGLADALISGVKAKIIDLESMKTLPSQERGEIWLRGPNIIRGYLNNPEATKSMIGEEGWLRTGDIGYFNKEGELFIVERLKDIIKSYCYQVAPAELEGSFL